MPDESPRYMPFYLSYEVAISRLPEQDQLQAYKALFSYYFFGIEPKDLSLEARLIFDLSKPSLEKAKDNCQKAQKAARTRWGKEKK